MVGGCLSIRTFPSLLESRSCNATNRCWCQKGKTTLFGSTYTRVRWPKTAQTVVKLNCLIKNKFYCCIKSNNPSGFSCAHFLFPLVILLFTNASICRLSANSHHADINLFLDKMSHIFSSKNYIEGTAQQKQITCAQMNKVKFTVWKHFLVF